MIVSREEKRKKEKTNRQTSFTRNTARPAFISPTRSKHLRPPTPLTSLPHPLQHLDARERLDRRPRSLDPLVRVGVLAVRSAGTGGGLEREDLAAVLAGGRGRLLSAEGGVEAGRGKGGGRRRARSGADAKGD